MRLRNKKTGEIIDLDIANIKAQFGGISVIPEPVKLGGDEYVYHSLAELLDEWEDYKPKEPLVKNEKIRKAVRVWAEANSRDLFRVINEHFNCCKIIGYTDGGNASCNKIEFGTTIAGADKNYYYTIDELCGEEEE